MTKTDSSVTDNNPLFFNNSAEEKTAASSSSLSAAAEIFVPSVVTDPFALSDMLMLKNQMLNSEPKTPKTASINRMREALAQNPSFEFFDESQINKQNDNIYNRKKTFQTTNTTIKQQQKDKKLKETHQKKKLRRSQRIKQRGKQRAKSQSEHDSLS